MTDSTALVVPEWDDRDLSTLSLDEVACVARREFALCKEATESAVLHATRCGFALLTLRERAKPGRWLVLFDRCRGSKFSRGTGYGYIRLALAWPEIPMDIPLKAALDMTPTIYDQGARVDHAGGSYLYEQISVAAKDLRSEGLSINAIAKALGVSFPTARYALRPDLARQECRARYARQREARKALAAQEREKAIRAAVRSSGKGVSKLYASLERMQDEFAEARAEVDDLGEIETLYRRLRDEFVSKALGVA